MAVLAVECPNCGVVVYVSDDREVGHVTREETERDHAAHIIVETGVGGSRLLHRCLITDQ